MRHFVSFCRTLQKTSSTTLSCSRPDDQWYHNNLVEFVDYFFFGYWTTFETKLNKAPLFSFKSENPTECAHLPQAPHFLTEFGG